MKQLRLATLSLVVILALVLPSLALADAPVRFQLPLTQDQAMMPCPQGFVIMAAGTGTLYGTTHYDRDGQIDRTFNHLVWDAWVYNKDNPEMVIYGKVNFARIDTAGSAPGLYNVKVSGINMQFRLPSGGMLKVAGLQMMTEVDWVNMPTVVKSTGVRPSPDDWAALCAALTPPAP